jgi:diguanylate cyclase (GGDEF)-like protein
MSEISGFTHGITEPVDFRSLSEIQKLEVQLKLERIHNENLRKRIKIKHETIITLSRLATEKGLESTSDRLTGTKSRNYFESEIRPELTKFVEDRKNGQERVFPKNILLCFIDLNGLKQINDSEGGHLIGDEAIMATAQGLKSAVRQSDTVCRYGGDEFCVVIRSEVTDPELLAKIPGNIEHRALEIARVEFAERYFLHTNTEHTHKLNFSMGSVSLADFCSFEEALNTADALMYEDKQQKKKLSQFNK